MDCLTREVAPEYDGPTINCPRCTARIAVAAPTGWTVRSPRDVYDHLGVELAALEREELRVVVLNAKNLVVRVAVAYAGNVSASLVRVGELFRDAVRMDASGIVWSTTTRAATPTPSPDDLHLTAEAIAAGRLLDIDVLDHVVIGSGGWASLRDRGVTFDRASAR